MERSCVVIARGSNFPYGIGASREKTLLMGKLFMAIGYDTKVVSSALSLVETSRSTYSEKGEYEGIHYFLPATVTTHTSKLAKVGLYVTSLIRISRYFIHLRRNYDSLTLLYSQALLPTMVLFKLLSVLLRFPLVIHVEEWPTAFERHQRNGWMWRLNDYFFCQIAPKLSDGAIYISDYLREKLRHANPHLKTLKIPVLADFSVIENIPHGVSKPDIPSQFVYCARTDYLEVTEFILDSYIALRNRYPERDMGLTIVLHGNTAEIRTLQNRFKEYPSICILSDLAYPELIRHLKSARALLIPLRPTAQDAARFPHKIAEYTATKRPIITTWHGEIKNFFTDKLDALIMREYTFDALVEHMQYVIDYPDDASQIGENGYRLGKREFAYTAHAQSLAKFMSDLTNP